jgi:hypothetical protein
MKYEFEIRGRAKVFLGPVAWVYIEVPRKMSEVLSDFGTGGYRFLPLEVKVGSTCWRTSLLPLKKNGGKFIALKKEVRKAEGIEVGDMVKVLFRVRL